MLDDVVITEELSQRSPRPPNLLLENQALHTLAQQLVNQPETMLQSLVDIALNLCCASSAGVSLLETTPNGEEVFRPNVLAGALAQYVGGTTPRKESPCGVCLDRGVPVLFSHPERYFTYFQAANTPIVEGLVLPLIADNHALGSIWIMSHDEQRHFDAEDVRVMTSLADFTAAALLLNQQQTQELLAVNAAKTAEIVERKQAEERSRALIENLPGGAAFVVDRDLRYLLAEGEALSAAGFKPEDLVGRTIFEVLPPELTASYEVLYRMALAGEPFEYEHTAHARSYISRGTPLRSPNGEVYAALAVSYDISDRRQAEVAIAADLEDTQRLRELSARLVAQDDIQTLYQEIVATAIALARADAGSIQILDEATQELVMLANQGAGQKLTDHFYRVNAASNTPCGIALTTGKRTFVDFDVPESEDPHGSMRLHREEGYVSAQSTPLITRSGKAIGMVSTHWCKHHRPSDRELRFLDLLARQAADLIEQRQAEAAIAADLRDTQRLHELSTYLASEDNVQALYDEIVAAAVDLMQADAGTIQILEEETQYILLLASQGLEQKTVEYFYRLGASSNTACGIALATRKRAIINYDVPASEDPGGSLQKLVEAGFLCGQSTPLISRSGKAIGMVSTHWRKHHRPSDRELRFLDLLARQAADLIEQRQAQVALRESEERLQAVANLVPDLLWDSKPDGSTNWYNQRWMEYTGQTFDGAISWGWIDAIHPDDRAASARRYREAVEQGVPLQQEHRIRRHDGEYRWFVVNGFLLKNESGKVIKMYGAATDIHEARISLEALRESEAKYRSLFESMNDGLAINELVRDESGRAVDARYLELNPAYERQTGFDRSSTLGRLASEVYPNYYRSWLEIVERVVRTGQPERFEHFVPDNDKWFVFQVTPFGGADGFTVLYDDITERKHAAEQLRCAALMDAFRVKLSDALRSLSDPLEIQRAAMHTLGEYLALDRAMYAEITPDETVIVNDNYLSGRFPAFIGEFPLSAYGSIFDKLRNGEQLIVADIDAETELTEAEKTNYKAIGSTAFVTTPLIKDGRWVSNLVVHQGEPRRWTTEEIAVLQETAERTWAAVERARAEDALRESEAKYRSLFQSMDEGYAVVEVLSDDNGEWSDFLFLEVNPAFERQTGMVNVFGRKATEILGTPNPSWAKIYGRVAQTGDSMRFEQKEETLDRIFDLYALRLGEAGSRRVAVLFTDITDRKHAEEQLRSAAEMDAFRVKLSDALRSLTDPVEIQAVAARLLGEYLGANQVHYGETIGEYVFISQGYGNGLPPMVGRFRSIDFGERLIADYRAGRTSRNSDVVNDPNIPESERQVITGAGFRAYIAVPLTTEKGWVATLAVHSIVPRDWTTDEVELVQETAERTWAAVERARGEDALRESEIGRVREQAAREQERQRAEALAELDRAKTLFFSNVSHEFRTPLTLLLASLQDALSDRTHPLPPAHRERLQLAHHNSLRLLKLVNTLLDFSRIEAGRMEAVYEPTDLAMFTTELASVFRSAIERSGLRLIVDCPPLPEPVYVDREMWEKIVLNLLSNAFKFTLSGEIAVRLYPQSGDRVLLQVQDTGTGIPPEELPHLFERFYQVRGAASRTHEGSGIGLALVQELIKMHGGSVDVSSVVGVGTSFTVTIPLGTAHLPSDRLRRVVGDRTTTTRTLTSTAVGATPYVEEAERWLPTEDGSVEFSVLSSLEENSLTQNSKLKTQNSQTARVLLVDDNADMRSYLTRILSNRFQVEAVADGAAALAAARARVPDLVLSDVMMPQLNGFQLLQALRDNPQTREIPIILLSASAGEESVVEGLEAGADDYLIKPFSAQELVSRVNAHLQMAQLRLEALHQERTINRRKDELLSTVSHELSTPLVAILGWTRLLRSNPSNQSMLMKSLETIERNAKAQAKLVEDLLDISRITAGKISLGLEPVELQQAIEEATASVSQSLKTKEISLECLLDQLPRIVQGDPNRLQQIFLNLLTNAIKFTPNGGRIEVRLEANETQALIVLTDNGCGIPALELPYIFDTFRQGVRSNKGLGLGLAIARHLVELHNGTIHAESSGVGLGATFIVVLPILQQ